MLNFFQKRHYSKRSFTIIELLIAIVVFTFVIMATLGIYITTIQRHFQAQKTQAVDEELRFAMEMMAKDIKDGFLMRSDDSDIDGKIDTIYIANQNKLTKEDISGKSDYDKCIEATTDFSACVSYKIDDDGDDPEKNGIWVKYGSLDAEGAVRLTSERIILKNDGEHISSFQIFSQGTPLAVPKDSPLVKINITALASKDTEKISQIELKTSVNQEELENHYQGNL